MSKKKTSTPQSAQPRSEKRKNPVPSADEVFAEMGRLQKLVNKEQTRFSWLMTSAVVGLALVVVGLPIAHLLLIPGGAILALFGLLNLRRQRRIINQLKGQVASFSPPAK